VIFVFVCVVLCSYKFVTYGEVEKEAIDFGAGLASLGAKPKDSIAIWSINRPEWVIAFLGFHSQSYQTVSLYATLGPDAVKYICEHAECEIVISEKANLKNLLAVAPALKKLKVYPCLFVCLWLAFACHFLCGWMGD
jgi:long-chain acyl-CoA synthetase